MTSESAAYEQIHRDGPDPEPVNDPEQYANYRIEITGLPPYLPQGTYAVYFSGMVKHPVADIPVMRFRFAGIVPQQQMPPADVQPEPERTGEPRSVERDLYGEALQEQRRENPVKAQAQPDLYQVSTVETLNVSKLARVITALLRLDVIPADELGMPPGAERATPQDIERWLRS